MDRTKETRSIALNDMRHQDGIGKKRLAIKSIEVIDEGTEHDEIRVRLCPNTDNGILASKM